MGKSTTVDEIEKAVGVLEKAARQSTVAPTLFF
jgi:hypothetical protein